jgi:Calcineurin-like phosphoesterase/Purple acid Phosphatase, N-terminal domain
MKSIYLILFAQILSFSAISANDFINETGTNHLAYTLSVLENTSPPPPPVLTRGPYLQVGTQTSIIIRWRTDIAENSRITWGTGFGVYTNTVDSATSTTEHIVQISGLTPDTKYWYTIGSSTQTLQATATNYFLTLPPSNTTRKLRFLALGDCGNNSANQVNVKNTFINYIGSNDIDALLLLGDNAYSFGTDAEYQTNFFNIYKDDLLKYYKLYPSPGNHDYGNSSANTGNTGSTPALSMPYHLNFSVPSAGENGGVPSNVKNYYSYNIGNVHFISLDSYGKDDGNTTKLYDTSGAQATWLKADLAASTKRWTVAYFHHPPYTKTSHSSDYNAGAGELDLVAVREKFVRILERNGVDLILCGHSHGYERSYLLKGFYNTYASPLEDVNFNAATHTATGNTQNGKYDGSANSCAYTYNSGQYNHGSIYIVSGSAGQVSNASQAAGYPQNCMYYSYVNVNNGGSLYFEVDSNRLDVKFISYTTAPTPIIRDQLTIFKDVNKTQNINVVLNDPITLTASWKGTYYWPANGGATTRSVTLNNNATGTFVYPVSDNSSGSCMQDVFTVTVSGALPVTLTSFTATLNNDKVLLNWSTSQENNNKYFTIEKSNDGTSFYFLEKLNGAGTSSLNHNYQLIDYTPTDGINYYRLSQTDIDGNTKIYEVKTVNYKSSKSFSAGIINNGKGSQRVIIRSTKASKISMKIVDITGKEILQKTFSLNNGGAVKNISLNPGVYVLLLMNDTGERISNKLIVRY